MNPDSRAAVIANELDSLAHCVEALPAHPRYTDALAAIQAARDAINEGRADLHAKAMQARFTDLDGAVAQ